MTSSPLRRSSPISRRAARRSGAWARRLLLLSAAAGLLGGCIERPESPRSRRDRADRSRASEVLLREPAAPRYPVGATFGDAVELVGYDLSPDPARAGQAVKVTFYFRAKAEVDDDWKIFVHLDDPAGNHGRLNADHWPAGERFHTSLWNTGDVVRDEFTFKAPASGQERLEMWMGLYRGNDRMPLSHAGRGRGDGNNRLRAGTLSLR